MSKLDKVFHVTGTGIYMPVGYVREVALYTGETSDFGAYYGEFPLIPCCLVDGQQAYFVCCPVSRASTWDTSRMPLTDMKISYNGTDYYICAGYNTSSTSEPIPDPDPDPYTYTYTSYTAVHLDGVTANDSRPTTTVTYYSPSDAPWNSIYTSDWYKTIYEVTRDDGIVKYCNSQNFNDTIEDGWWHMRPIDAVGKNNQGHYVWEAFYCWSFVDGYRQTYGGGYEIVDTNDKWDMSQQSLYPEATRQLE